MSQPHSSSVFLLEQCLLGAVALAWVALLSLPAARGVSETFGWLPFWMLSLPLSAWAVARVLRRRGNRRLAQPMATVHPIGAARLRVQGAQALRRAA
ncbi:MAG: hypothetical protein HOP03_05440 [Lysobacter sp.]|nr:hypothetical protein [Lysobacter sp.]